MGQAKIRKKNGTYPSPAQIAQMEEERIRWNTEVWYPSANDLAPFSAAKVCTRLCWPTGGESGPMESSKL